MKNPTPSEQHGSHSAADTSKPFKGGWLHGAIVGVEPSRDLLFFRAKETKRTLVIRWVPETQFAIQGRPASSADLLRGRPARIHCRVANHELEADHVSIEPAETHPQEQWTPPLLRDQSQPSILYGKQEVHPHRG